MPFAIAFIGRHNSGKTTLATQVAKELKALGLKVGVLKSSKEPRPRIEESRSDTSRFWQEGVAKIAFWGKEECFLRFYAPEKDDFTFWYFIKRFFPEEDIVICEGFKGIRSVPKIEVVNENLKEPPLYQENIPGLIAVVGAKTATGYQNLPPEPAKIARFIMARLPRRETATLLVDGKPVGLTRFVSRALVESLKGFLRTLRGVKNPEIIELRIELPKDKS
ncbi:molybdopterin-guanine dinucleotide biosynthesis protein B [Thermodesulfatator atlanticus]|uniref:molybdopterin-guanine dinucleotide biosynthesis protein B n=1 Tax=Thermodesulfatator atlanticus TaxID=501497 RepID=UPI0003B55D0F|nr:molybdopterin-guanine dinucleotide biosynthesis protein MobB [Thermodesulfatator atlanticus]